MSFIHWKWTQGDPYERSRRRIKPPCHSSHHPPQNRADPYDGNSSTSETIFYDNKVLDDEEIQRQSTNAYHIALNHDENSWDILNQTYSGGGNRGFESPAFEQMKEWKQVNKREDTDKKLAERQITGNVHMNPYMVNNNYVSDICNQNQCLRPSSGM